MSPLLALRASHLWAGLWLGLGAVGCADDESMTLPTALDGSAWYGASYRCDPLQDPYDLRLNGSFTIHPRLVLSPQRGLELDMGPVLSDLGEEAPVFLATYSPDPPYTNLGEESFAGWDVGGFASVAVRVAVADVLTLPARTSDAMARSQTGGVALPDHLVGVGTLDDGSCVTFTAFP